MENFFLGYKNLDNCCDDILKKYNILILVDKYKIIFVFI